jgi:hypothetical protein
MLVSMKQHVLEHAGPRPRRRRRVGLVVGVVSVLLLGAAGGSVALGLIPTADTAAPAPVAPSTPEPSLSETPTGEPVVDQATPTPTPTAPTRAPYSSTYPSTWTITGAEVGPLALGGPVDGELDDLTPAFTREVQEVCSDDISSWRAEGVPRLTVVAGGGVVRGVALGLGAPSDGPGGPTTAEGLGVGSLLADVQAAYPDLEQIDATEGSAPADGTFARWTIRRDGAYVTFITGQDPTRIGMVWVSPVASPPYEFCG